MKLTADLLVSAQAVLGVDLIPDDSAAMAELRGAFGDRTFQLFEHGLLVFEPDADPETSGNFARLMITAQWADEAKTSLAADEIVALDPSSDMIARLDAQALANVRTVNHALTRDLVVNDPVFATRFHLVTASSVSAFVPDLADTLSVIRGLPETGGRFEQ
ncbi:MAG: hypothetical protein CL566_01140 [Alphaproteobacteria bacterium]|nr:hypothetical protein [Alphaproteobacteria bacterium]|tara:strand:- start:602 stop:1084 length:483 start_codon:yes stop_codon:yes gene_type:complete